MKIKIPESLLQYGVDGIAWISAIIIAGGGGYWAYHAALNAYVNAYVNGEVRAATIKAEYNAAVRNIINDIEEDGKFDGDPFALKQFQHDKSALLLIDHAYDKYNLRRTAELANTRTDR